MAMTFSLVVPTNAQPAFKKGGVPASEVSQSSNGIYIVQMLENPVVAYEGGIKGLKATKPENGKKINPLSPAVVDYVSYLENVHDAILVKVGGEKVYDYHYTFNGFAAQLSFDQAKSLAFMDGVIAVSPDELYTVDTSNTPSFLGLDAPGGLWDQLGGVSSAGEDIIIGIVDSGIWPDSLSFSDRTGTNGNATKDGKLSYQQIPGWHGKCVPGEEFTASDCNQKLIGAQYFNASWGGDAGIAADRPWEFTSPRDYNGHGTHTASTAGGNNNTPTTGPAAAFGSISGIAPRARIAAYKALWSTEDASTASGRTGDLVAAIDQAVADGVDVINYSISGTRTNFLDPVEVSFLYAADAGIFVAESAGNSGPGANTVAHPGPWTTTVAASTHDRPTIGSVTFGNGDTYEGASVATVSVSADLIDSVNAGLAGADPEEVRLCYPGTLDPAEVAGKIVACDRGVIARVDKSLAVQLAGGVGTILVNVTPGSLNADLHFVPTIHLDDTVHDAVKAYAGTSGATATINPAYASAPAPAIAAFSSRGPLLAGDGDVLKPDLSAPGVDILAAVAPPGNNGRDFDIYSGTSMSSPHVAGLAALLMDLHPNWSPMMIKSALMTTGSDLVTGADPFAQGAGHVVPNSAADPGLVYDASWLDWLGFLCGTGQLQASYCPAIGFDPSDYNSASIAIGALAGVQTVKRTVKNVSGVSETYEFSYTLPGIDVVANPSSFTVAPGGSASYELTFTVVSATPSVYATGFVYWTGSNGHIVRSPVAVRPLAIAGPAEVSGTGVEGEVNFDITFGYTGDYTAAPHGLTPALMTAGNVPDDPGDSFTPFGPGTTLHMISIPAGSLYARFSLFDAYTDGNDDLDLYVYYPNGSYADGSGSGTSAEQVDLTNPPAGDYYVFVHGWETDGPDANYTLFSWAVGIDEGNMTLTAPATATLGATETVTVDWAGLAAGTKYLGAVSHSDAVGILDLTLISVDTD